MSTPAFLSLPLSEIGESPHNPRSQFVLDELEELAKSAGAEVIVADAEARRVAAELRVIDLESRALRLEEERNVALALLVRVVKYEREDRAVTPRATRLARVCEEARALLARVGGAP